MIELTHNEDGTLNKTSGEMLSHKSMEVALDAVKAISVLPMEDLVKFIETGEMTEVTLAVLDVIQDKVAEADIPITQLDTVSGNIQRIIQLISGGVVGGFAEAKNQIFVDAMGVKHINLISTKDVLLKYQEIMGKNVPKETVEETSLEIL